MDDDISSEVIRILNRELKETQARLKAAEEQNEEYRRQVEDLTSASVKGEVADDPEVTECQAGICTAANEAARLHIALRDAQRALGERPAISPGYVKGLEVRLERMTAALNQSGEARRALQARAAHWEETHKRLREGILGLVETVDSTAGVGDGTNTRIGDGPTTDPRQPRRAAAAAPLDIEASKPLLTVPAPPLLLGNRYNEITEMIRFCHTKCAIEDVLFLPPSRMAISVINPQRAIISTSSHIFNGETWFENLELRNLVGQRREVFYKAKGSSNVHYVGTYEIVRVVKRNAHSEEWMDIDEGKRAGLLSSAQNTAIAPDLRGPGMATKMHLQTVQARLRESLIWPEFAHLQWVGVHVALYHCLRREIRKRIDLIAGPPLRMPPEGQKRHDPFDDDNVAKRPRILPE